MKKLCAIKSVHTPADSRVSATNYTACHYATAFDRSICAKQFSNSSVTALRKLQWMFLCFQSCADENLLMLQLMFLPLLKLKRIPRLRCNLQINKKNSAVWQPITHTAKTAKSLIGLHRQLVAIFISVSPVSWNKTWAKISNTSYIRNKIAVKFKAYFKRIK